MTTRDDRWHRGQPLSFNLATDFEMEARLAHADTGLLTWNPEVMANPNPGLDGVREFMALVLDHLTAKGFDVWLSDEGDIHVEGLPA